MGTSVLIQKSLAKRAEGNEKKTKKLLAGYEKIIKGKVEEINSLASELTKATRERIAIQTLQDQENSSMQARIG